MPKPASPESKRRWKRPAVESAEVVAPPVSAATSATVPAREDAPCLWLRKNGDDGYLIEWRGPHMPLPLARAMKKAFAEGDEGTPYHPSRHRSNYWVSLGPFDWPPGWDSGPLEGGWDRDRLRSALDEASPDVSRMLPIIAQAHPRLAALKRWRAAENALEAVHRVIDGCWRIRTDFIPEIRLGDSSIKLVEDAIIRSEMREERMQLSQIPAFGWQLTDGLPVFPHGSQVGSEGYPGYRSRFESELPAILEMIEESERWYVESQKARCEEKGTTFDPSRFELRRPTPTEIASVESIVKFEAGIPLEPEERTLWLNRARTNTQATWLPESLHVADGNGPFAGELRSALEEPIATLRERLNEVVADRYEALRRWRIPYLGNPSKKASPEEIEETVAGLLEIGSDAEHYILERLARCGIPRYGDCEDREPSVFDLAPRMWREGTPDLVIWARLRKDEWRFRPPEAFRLEISDILRPVPEKGLEAILPIHRKTTFDPLIFENLGIDPVTNRHLDFCRAWWEGCPPSYALDEEWAEWVALVLLSLLRAWWKERGARDSDLLLSGARAGHSTKRRFAHLREGALEYYRRRKKADAGRNNREIWTEWVSSIRPTATTPARWREDVEYPKFTTWKNWVRDPSRAKPQAKGSN